MVTKIIYLCIMIFFLFISLHFGQELKLELSIDKKEYIVGEPILVRLKIINISGKAIKIDNIGANQLHASLGFYPFIIGENHDKNVYNVTTTDSYLGSEYSLDPGDTAYINFNLLKGYQNCTIKSIKKWKFSHFIETDSYIFYYELLNRNEKRYISNEVKFSIISPSEKESNLRRIFKEKQNVFNEQRKIIEENLKSRYILNFIEESLYSIRKSDNINGFIDNLILSDTSNKILDYLLFFNTNLGKVEKNRIIEATFENRYGNKKKIVDEIIQSTKFDLKRKEFGKIVKERRAKELELLKSKQARSKQNEK
ncbi:MAG: hypothetical protein COW71_05945 [Ignavibacteriales bacterium CG18_big_fil_WC_8_21_14_2_50_31_20]|nr:MAG: hypothetical protein COW71_05945 [Ignavibacteriales bacterium CG18_big_fil_WC_8_21_14_2_50_31_20]